MASGSRKKRKGLRLFGITARALMLAAGALLLLSYLSQFINPVRAWWMTLFGILFIPLFALNLFLLLWAIRRRSRAVAIPLLALLPAFFVVGRYYQIPQKNESPADEGITVVSYNVGRFTQYAPSKVGSSGACADSVIAFLKRCDADVICLQEFYLADASRLQSFFKKNFPGYEAEYYFNISDSGAYGNVTLSRFHVVGKGKFDFEQSANLAVYTDLRVGAEKIRVYNCHFQSYNVSPSRFVEAVSGHNEELRHQTEEQMRSSIRLRPQQVDTIFKDIDACEDESIIAGDFNDTPMSYTYHRLKRGHLDTFREAGHGFGGTFAHFRHLLRIDYVLSPERYEVISYDIPRVRFSDHFPIVTRLDICQ